jgi:hypothetical protein
MIAENSTAKGREGRMRILNCTSDRQLQELRASVLRSAIPCEVVSPGTPEEALSEIRKRGYDVLLVCYDLDENLVDGLIAEFRRSCPGGRVVAIQRVTWTVPREADEIVDVLRPVDLIMAIQRVTGVEQGSEDSPDVTEWRKQAAPIQRGRA